MSKPVAWSYSVLNNFLTCPKQYHEVRVLKNYKEDRSEALVWGDYVHAGIAATLANGTPLAENLQAYAGLVERFRKVKGVVATEQQLAITRSFTPAEWFGRDVWCRGIFDAVWVDGDVAKIVDWKTGKRKPDSRQLLLFALLAFVHMPQVKRVNSAFVWLQTGKMDVAKYDRKDAPKLWQEILPEVRRLELAHANDVWVPRPSGLCRAYCPVMSCSFNERAELQRKLDQLQEQIA
jgi:hypothetical protein